MGSAMRKTGSTATPIRAFTDSALHTDRVKTSDFRLARTALFLFLVVALSQNVSFFSPFSVSL